MNTDTIKTMKIIAIVESDDYGAAAILESDCISVTRIDDFYFAAARCVFTQMPITCEISEKDAKLLMNQGVNCISISSDSFGSEDTEGIKK